MAQVENFKGKLGFEHRSEEKLALALTKLLETLEEFGHPAMQMNAREKHRIGLDCDDYQVSLRLRRIPLRLGVRTPPGLPAPAAYIELVMTPRFATRCDPEISEILLAMILKRLTEALNPLVIFWRETTKALTCTEFLGAFTPVTSVKTPVACVKTQAPAARTAMGTPRPQPQKVAPYVLRQQPAALCPNSAEAPLSPQNTSLQSSAPDKPTRQKKRPAETLSAERAAAKKIAHNMSSSTAALAMADKARAEAEAQRSRGQMRFGSVEDASTVLQQHCEDIQMVPVSDTARQHRPFAGPNQQVDTTYQSIFGQSQLGRVLAFPRVLFSAMLNAVRSVDLVFSLRALIAAMVVFFLHGSGMVQAAARVLMP